MVVVGATHCEVEELDVATHCEVELDEGACHSEDEVHAADDDDGVQVEEGLADEEAAKGGGVQRGATRSRSAGKCYSRATHSEVLDDWVHDEDSAALVDEEAIDGTSRSGTPKLRRGKEESELTSNPR